MTTIDEYGAAEHRVLRMIAAGARALVAAGHAIAASYRYRRDAAILAEMHDAQLKDIGISRSDIPYVVRGGRGR
jgi:uncharacterized protein YjiS (DUF1127 family)